MALLLWVSIVIFLFDAAASTETSCEGNAFKDDALEWVNAKYKQTRRGIDFSKIEVECQPFSMVEHGECADPNELKLEFNNDGLDVNWETVKEREDRHGKYKWTLEATPCKTYYFKLEVGGKGFTHSLLMKDLVKAVSFETLTAKGYEPPKLETPSLQFEIGSKDVTVNWEDICSEEIEVIYWPTKGWSANKTEREPTSSGSAVLSRGIESCSEYSYEVYAVVGNQESEPLEGSFSTVPLEDSTFTDNPNVTVGLTSITVAWNPDQLPCVDRYNLTVCEIGGLCFSRDLEKGNLPKISYTLNYLRECTKYNISLLPLHKDANMKPFIKQEVRTTSNDKLEPQLEVIGDNQVNISWSSIYCAHSYLVYHYEGDEVWKHIDTNETSIKLNVTPCVRNSYAVAYTIDGMPGDQHVDLQLPEKDEELKIPVDSFKSAVNESGKAFFSWAPVPCAEKYVISAMDSKDQVVEVTTTNTSVKIEVSPCNKYTFRLKAVVGSREIEMGHQEITTQLNGLTKYVPKNLNVTYSPLGGVNVAWDAPDCVLGFAVRVLNQENVLTEYDVRNYTFEENNVSVKLFCNSSVFYAPVDGEEPPFKQATNNVLRLGVSPIVSSEEEGSQILKESIVPLGNICASTKPSDIVNSNSYVVPILIAVFVFLGALVVVLVFVIKKRKNSLIYDTENGKIIKPYSQLSRSTEEIEMNENSI